MQRGAELSSWLEAPSPARSNSSRASSDMSRDSRWGFGCGFVSCVFWCFSRIFSIFFFGKIFLEKEIRKI